MKLTVCLSLALALGCAVPPAVQQHAAVGHACNPSDCQLVTADGSPCPMDGTTACRLVCPACGPGVTCASDGVCGVQCGNGNVVCDPGTLCALRGTSNHDCLPRCTVAGATVYRPGTDCEARGLEFEEATGRCFVPCYADECLIVGDNYCGPAVAARASSRGSL